MTSKPSYYDYASTTPVDPRVLEAMLPFFTEDFGNPGSNHSYGKQAKRHVDSARNEVAQIINADSKEIYFTSGATEAINLGIKGFLEANPEKGNHIITVKTEHKAVLATCEYLESHGYHVTYLDVDENGLISMNALKRAINDRTCLIAIMYVNNETGVLQDIPAIGQIAREHSICFFCDATQAIGKVSVDVVNDAIDMLCISAHKMYGPKGIGALYVRKDLRVNSMIHGGGQEFNLRSGTLNVPGIVGLGVACNLARIEFDERLGKMQAERKRLTEYFEGEGIGKINFSSVKCAPHILSVTLNTDEDADEFLMLKSKDFVASTGSACNTNIVEGSHVLKAMGLNFSIIRISVSC